MLRLLRIHFPGAIYHLMNRGDRRESIFHDDQDRRCFLDTLGEAREKTGWHESLSIISTDPLDVNPASSSIFLL